MKYLSLALLLFITTCVLGQLSDDFTDGDFTNNPAWGGNTSGFDINSGMLHSNGPQAASTIYLSTPNVLIDGTEWNFLLRLDFNPSSTNQVRVFLVSDQSDLTGSLNGYFIQFGEAGTAPDSLDIFKQTGVSATKIFTGASGVMTSTSSNQVRIKVIRHPGGSWEVYADKSGGTNYTAEGTFTDSTYTTTTYFGVVCDYATASRYNLYYFDDFNISAIISDTTKPMVTSVSLLTSTAADIKFSEPVEVNSAQTVANYSINNGIGNPASVVPDGTDPTLVHLTFANPLQNAVNYLLSVSGVQDLAGNTMLPYTSPLSFYTPGAYDILINEIFADPDPKVGLPLVEFVELYNRTAFPVSLNGWKFSDASTSVTLPNATILPDSFMLLCAAVNIDSFSSSVAKAGLSSLPSLNNTGDDLTLKDNFGNVIHSVNYSDSWYNNSSKKNGGWTLELINPETPCKSSGNWIASNDSSGGTPGRRNSVYDTTQTMALSLVSVNVLSASQIEVVFSENVDVTSAQTPANYTVQNGVGSPVNALRDSVDFTKVKLTFSPPLDTNTVYVITANVQSCTGAPISANNSQQFALPKAAGRYDVLINEFMADPDPPVGLPNAEFVELYNRSNKIIHLKNWTLTKPTQNGAVLPEYLLYPDSFLIITGTTSQAAFTGYGNTLGLASFPSLTNTGDQILLKDQNNNLIHSVSYDDSWYQDDAKKSGGWSLEMIDTENPCNGKDNWRASVSADGGTPGQMNSIAQSNPDTILPRLIRATLEDSNTLILYFSESVANDIGSNAANYVVNNGVGAPVSAVPVPFNYQTVRLEFTQNFQPGLLYSVRVLNMNDCSGNPIGMNDSARFAIPDTAAAGDVLINEILFNPKTAGYDFVELYNNSAKVIDLKQLDIIEKDLAEPAVILEQSAASDESYLLLPGEFAVLTANPENIQLSYYVENPLALVQSSIPNFPDDAGICVLKIHNGITIDSLSYSHTWHFGLLDVEDGVSLERIDYGKPTQDKSNWHSAASTVGFATPSYRNSQYSETGITDDNISIDPEVFSPDNDGDKDFTLIKYRFAEPGYNANLRIYDANGRLIRDLVHSELLGSEGQFQWDGTDDNNHKARVGIYIAYIEVFNLEGKVKRFKKQMVLSGKF